MLSRRNVRVKVMQVLYAVNRDKELASKSANTYYQKSINQSYQLYLINLLQLHKVAEYSKEDAGFRLSKHLPTDEDKIFSPKLFENQIIQMITQSEGFHKLAKKDKLHLFLDKDITKKLYKEFSKTEQYKEYINNQACELEDHRKVLLDLYKSMTKNDLFNEIIDDRFVSWQEDKSLVIGAIKKTLKDSNLNLDFYEPHLPDKETVEEFGADLLYKVNHFDDELVELIEPNLKNWEMDRVATLDMILIKMALCELMHFETIPTKVTINEFVEISKIYSTPKSKEFINGILDKLMKILQDDGKIKKVGRGLLD